MSVLILIGLLFLQGTTGVYHSFKDGYSANPYAYHLGIFATALSLVHIAVASASSNANRSPAGSQWGCACSWSCSPSWGPS